MPVVFWSEEYETGNSEIDQQHQHLFSLVNALEIACTSGEGAATTDLVLAHLLRYLARHFSTEESLMRAVDYPEFTEHQHQHTACSRKVAELLSRVQTDELDAMEFVAYIRDWLHEHLLLSDRKYAFWLQGRPEAVSLWTKEVHRHACDSAPV
jgi:hemerythrin